MHRRSPTHLRATAAAAARGRRDQGLKVAGIRQERGVQLPLSMLSFPKSCRRAVLCAALLVVPLVAASEGAVAPLEQAASSTTTTIGRNEALARSAGCADDVVRTSFADGAEPLQSTARAVFWGCVFYGGWPDGELTDDLSHHEKLVDSILAGAALDSAVTLTLDLAEAQGLITRSGTSVTRRQTACYAWVSVYAVARVAMTSAAAASLAEPDYTLCN